MRALIAILACAIALTVLPAAAQNACPCVPLTHLWTVKTCADWNCAAVELAVANGDPQVIAMPVALTDARWLILRRTASGTAGDSGNDSFRVEQFDQMYAATQRYMAIDHDHQPMLFTVPDGRMVVVSLREPEVRRRAMPHP